jgi:hypothetical protein
MKTLLLLCAALLLACGSQAQLLSPNQVPPLAFVALQQQYPLATQVQWKRTQGLYQVSFSQGSGQQFVRFTTTGDMESTGRPLALYYPSRQVCLAAKFVNVHTQVITYETATCESSISRTLVFTTDGRKVGRPSHR